MSNLVTVAVGTTGGITIFNHTGTTDVVVDVEGCYTTSVGTTGLYDAVTSTVSREVAANGGRGEYRACRSDRAALARARRPKTAKLKRCPRLKREVGARLNKRRSPQQIAATLQQDFREEPAMWISHEAIHQALFVRERCVFPADAHRLLRTGRPRRRAQRKTRQERRGKNPNMVMISDRPLEAANRLVPGHWEGDLIMGRGHLRAIGTLVERTTRYFVLLKACGRLQR